MPIIWQTVEPAHTKKPSKINKQLFRGLKLIVRLLQFCVELSAIADLVPSLEIADQVFAAPQIVKLL